MLVGCTDHGAGKLTELKDEVCACKTADCADKIMARIPQTKIDSNSRTQKLAREMLDCVARLQAVDRPETDPDAEGSADGSAAPGSAAPSAPAPGSAAPGSAAPSPATAGSAR